ncbi:MAG: type sorting protein, partial [Bacteroidetes bacterium]|nr:type sorting protein [Bacteroidota bacterium]
PSASAFAVRVNSTSRTVTSVAISGTKVNLTLASPVAYGETVTVAYTKPAASPLQTPQGGQAVTITAQTVTNSIGAPPAIPVYVGAVIENATPAQIDMTYNLPLASIIPSVSAFTVIVNSAAKSVVSVVVSGTKVLLTFSGPLVYGDVVTVAYTKPSSNPLQTPAGGQAATIAAQTVTNKINAPVAPVYLSSSVENSAPSVLEITYDKALANIVPASAAFTVQVNSVTRNIGSVAISGTKVLLNLSSPVVFNDVITFSYTKPSSNALQTASGGQAESISAQAATNRVNMVNSPPVIRINYPSSTYSGFLGEINATGSYDPNKDNLTYTWKVPDKVSVSSTNGSIIQFLAPVVEAVRRLDFTLTVNDGKTTVSETISIEILPYQPELELAEVIAVEASGFQYPHYPINIIDGNIATLWSADGTDQWITLELKEPFNIHHVILAFQSGLTREYYFDVLGSEDKVTWEPILTKSRSCAFSGDFQVFDFPPSKTGKEFKYVRLICQGNLADTWNNIAELRIFGYRFRTPSDYEKQTVKIFPNPAHNYFNVKIEESSVIHDYIRIINLSGNILLHKKIDPGVSEFHVPINLIKGVYLIQLGSEKIISYCQKLIVVN